MLEDAEGIEDFTARASSNAEGKSNQRPLLAFGTWKIE